MKADKELILHRIEERALREAEYLAGEFVRAASAEREAILAAMEVERWLAEACLDCWPTAERGPRDGF